EPTDFERGRQARAIIEHERSTGRPKALHRALRTPGGRFDARQAMGSAGTIGQGAVLVAAMDWRIFWASLGLVGVLILGAIIIGMVERWRKRSTDVGLSANDQLSHFRQLYDEGTITGEEFEQ